MPIETIIVVAAIVTMFAVFAGVLAWGAQQTQRLPARD
jgi:archaellin